MSHWIGLPGEYERAIVNMDQVIYINAEINYKREELELDK